LTKTLFQFSRKIEDSDSHASNRIPVDQQSYTLTIWITRFSYFVMICELQP